MFAERLIGLLAAALLVATTARAQHRSQPTYEITFERAMELARQQAPILTTAHARVQEARASADAASVWRFNPQLAASAGPRFGGSDVGVDWSVGAKQWLELGGQRGDRIDAAQGGLEAASAKVDDTERLLLREVGIAFAKALYWQRRIELAEENLRIADSIARVARRRHELGDTGGLDNSVASLSLSRARTGAARARIALGQAESHLKVLLGLEAQSTVAVRGDLRQLAIPAANSRAQLDSRPDLRALRAQARQAESQVELGRSARIPNVAVGASYSREEDADIVQGTVTVSLPFFDHGQGAASEARARRERIETELTATSRRASIESMAAGLASQDFIAAVSDFETGGLIIVERSENLATASYEAGAIPLGELLAVRRELVQAKLEYADLLLSAASARMDLMAAMGAIR